MLSALYVKHLPKVDADTLRKAEAIIKLFQLRAELFEQCDAMLLQIAEHEFALSKIIKRRWSQRQILEATRAANAGRKA